MGPYVLALDQGTTSSRSLLVNCRGQVVAISQKEFGQIYPQPAWVEHDALEIWETQRSTIRSVLSEAGARPQDIAAIGITNQRETTVVWDRHTGQPIHHAIVWQDRRTDEYCQRLKAQGHAAQIQAKTGLVVDAYFSATKLRWLLDHVPDARARAAAGDLLFGTIDSWLLWQLTGGRVHATDYTNASRTMLYNIHELCWDQDLCELMDVPMQVLPEVLPSSHAYGHADIDGVAVPIMALAGDQQAALFGQTCFDEGEAKNTYGTGCFMLMNMGKRPPLSHKGLLTTLIANPQGPEPLYAFEGSVFVAGAAIQWLRDGLEILADAGQSCELARSVQDSHDVYIVPAFAGLGTPYWDSQARGTILGITRDTTRAHIVKATLDSIAYQTRDILQTMESESGIALQSLNVDGGAANNDYLMQFQADLLGTTISRPSEVESTALGAAYLAGLAIGIWTADDLRSFKIVDKTYEPTMPVAQREHLYSRWTKAIAHARGWLG